MSNDNSDTRSSCENHIADDDRESSPPPIHSEVIAPVAATLVPLKTVLELRAEDAVTDVYITAVPVKSANSIITCASPPLFIASPLSNNVTVLCVLW